MTFLVRAVRDTGRDVLEIVRAWSAACEHQRRCGAARAARRGARAPDRGGRHSAPGSNLAAALERATLWLVQTQPPGAPLGELIERFREPVATLLARWPELLSPERRARARRRGRRAGRLPASTPPLADRLVRLGRTDEALEIAHIAHAAAIPLPRRGGGVRRHRGAGRPATGSASVLPSTLPGEDRWEPRAVASLLEVLLDMRRQLTMHVLGHQRSDVPIAECLRAFAATCRDQLEVVHGLIGDLKAARAAHSRRRCWCSCASSAGWPARRNAEGHGNFAAAE